MLARHAGKITGIAAALSPVGGLTGCAGMQSALDPAGHEAQELYLLFLGMCAGGAVVFISVVSLLIYAVHHQRRVHSDRVVARLILWGTVTTVAVLTVLLTFSLALWPGLRPVQAEGQPAIEITVTGHQFWWDVRYQTPDGQAVVVAANEVRLPVGERVFLTLESADMIHSFWIPALAGKMDMVPGRSTHLSLLATRPGVFRGPCAEYCGTSHALMAFSAVAMEPAAFTAWLAARRMPSPTAQAAGLQAFLSNGCGGCHTISGTEARGKIGPDLSHVGSRETIGAGILPNTVQSIARFIKEPDTIKPGVRMPSFRMLPDEEIAGIAQYLKGLQ
ncbi:cytochrome c oxidase subunit II [Tianweitania sediminis]|nr:cytochrome c oxidase subunit II [Tianweitania sediminis]